MANFTFWGVIASPFQLKMQSLADFAGHSWQRWPDQAPWPEGIKMALLLEKLRKKQSIQRFPRSDIGLDEYPAVPYYTEDGHDVYYDSTGLAHYLDQHQDRHELPLLPEEPELRFVCQLIDEAFDEFGLYMVHHNRWIVSAKTNQMGRVTGKEMGKLLPIGLGQVVARTMPQRQVRRCPYLFSVAPAGFETGVSKALTPPSRAGFPATHELLNGAWRAYLAALESLLQQQPYLLGDRFTLADASAYGQLSMNLIDGAAADLLESLAPTTFAWLCGIRDRAHVGSRGELYLSEHLAALLAIIGDTFVPLMQQNTAAYQDALAAGETLFNEAAFDQGRALYHGELQGYPFRSVAKSFQVPVWRDLCIAWGDLELKSQTNLSSRFPTLRHTAFAVN
ncbi:MAG: glutathione S-transferase domain-containing protein [Halioglobus sp.]